MPECSRGANLRTWTGRESKTPGMITRRTARFAKLAQLIEDACRQRGVEPDPPAVDRLLNAHASGVAALLGVTPRTALTYAPDDLPQYVNVESSRT